MKIEDKTRERPLEEIQPGSCFYFNHHLYMRLGDDMKFAPDGAIVLFPSIDFNSNLIVQLKGNTFVQPVNAKIVIE